MTIDDVVPLGTKIPVFGLKNSKLRGENSKSRSEDFYH
jgi:hypothetical protein